MEDQTPLDNFFNISIDATAREHLKTAATWARIIALIGFCSAGISLLSVFIENNPAGPAVLVGKIFGGLIGAAIAFLIYIFLLRFGNNMSASLGGMNQELFNISINNLRTYFKVLGIIFIIALSLLVLFLLFFGLGTFMSM